LTVKHNSLLHSITTGYMFRLLAVILRSSIEPKQDYLITSALMDLFALTIGGTNAVWNYSQVSKMIVVSVLDTLRMYIRKVTSTKPTLILETWE
jgi:hypothetical protein